MGEKISVLMPVRNVASTIDVTLSSLVKQTTRNLEILVGDDGSTDRTRSIVQRWSERDARIRLLPGDATGMVATLNRLLDRSRSPWVARMDGDDLLHPHRFAAQLALAAETEADALGCRIRLFPSQQVSPAMERWLAWQNALLRHEEILRDRFVETTISHATLLIRRERLDGIGGWREFDGPEDLDLLLRLAADGTRFAKVPRSHYFWRWHPTMSTRCDPRYRREAFRRCKIDRLSEGLLANGRPVHVWGVGRSLAAWVADLERRGRSVRSRNLDLRGLRRNEARRRALLESPPSPPLLLVFGTPGVREELRRLLGRTKLREERDFLFVA